MADGRGNRELAAPRGVGARARLLRRTFLGGLFASIPALADSEEKRRGTPAIAVLVRHAEKAADDPKDPSLSAAGRARAESLARILGETGVTHLFASEFRRTRDTLAPLADSTGLTVRVHPASDGPGLAELLRGLPDGAVAVVAGHSNTVPALARRLGARPSHLGTDGNFSDGEYDRFLVVPIRGGAGEEAPASLLDLRYGP